VGDNQERPVRPFPGFRYKEASRSTVAQQPKLASRGAEKNEIVETSQKEASPVVKVAEDGGQYSFRPKYFKDVSVLERARAAAVEELDRGAAPVELESEGVEGAAQTNVEEPNSEGTAGDVSDSTDSQNSVAQVEVEKEGIPTVVVTTREDAGVRSPLGGSLFVGSKRTKLRKLPKRRLLLSSRRPRRKRNC